MVLIAIVGGTSPTLGRAIVTSIQKTPNSCIILSRHSANAPKTKYGAEVRLVDYEDPKSLAEALRGVHTVISVLKIPPPYWATNQINLLNAAKLAGVKRFAPAEFEAGPSADGRVELLKVKLPVWDACLSSGLEVARFNCGMFMNHLALGRDFKGDTERELQVLGGFKDEPVIWDIAAGCAEEPVKDDGTSPRITLTLIDDIGKFIAAACELPNGAWQHDMGMVGETIAISEVTRLIEEATCNTQHVEKVDRQKLNQRVEAIKGCGSSKVEVLTKLESQLALLMIDEKEGLMIMNPVLNTLCPSVKPIDVKEYLLRCWKY
jgi:hypothetical protein